MIGQVEDIPRDEIFAEVEIDDTGVPHYVPRGERYGVKRNRASLGLGLADFNDDGYLDVYVTDNGANEMYLWREDGVRYEEASKAMNAELRYVGEGNQRTLSVNWGALPIDFDRDGALEMYVANGTLLYMPPSADTSRLLQTDHLLRQKKPGGAFLDVSQPVGLAKGLQTGEEGDLLTNRGVYRGDLDGDGDDDLVVGAFACAARCLRRIRSVRSSPRSAATAACAPRGVRKADIPTERATPSSRLRAATRRRDRSSSNGRAGWCSRSAMSPIANSSSKSRCGSSSRRAWCERAILSR
jgi:hypothetical protein